MIVSQCLEVKFPTIWTDGGDSNESRGRVRREEVRRERVRRQKVTVSGKGKNHQTRCVSQCFLKARSVGALLEVAMSKKCRSLCPETISTSKCTTHLGAGALLNIELVKKWTAFRSPKHIATSIFTKHFSPEAFLEVAILKKCTALPREANFQV